MLYYIWFFVLTITGFGFAYLSYRRADCSTTFMCSILFLFMSLIVSWPRIGGRLFNLLDNSLPNSGEDIHDLTVFVVIGMACLVWIAGPAFIAISFDRGNNKQASTN